MINVDVSGKNVMYMKKMFGILLHVIVKMENLQQVLWMIQQLCVMKLQSHTRKKQTLIKRATCKMQNIFILLSFFLITIALLIAFSIYCYLVKYRGNQKTLTILLLKQSIKKNYMLKMSNKVKDIKLKNSTYYFFDNINTTNFDLNI